MAISDEEFDWDAYHRDTRELSLAAKGAWWDCLYKMRLSVTRGRISMPIEGYARMFGSTADHAKNVLNEISEFRVGDAVTEHNGKITVTNRRMFRAFQEREANKNRQAEYRERKKYGENAESNGMRNGIVTFNPKKEVEEEESISTLGLKPQKKKPALVTKTRIPDPFPLTDDMRAWASEKYPALDVENAHEDFVTYYTNCTEKRAWNVDWRLTWQAGMKRAAGWQAASREKSAVGKFDPVQAIDFKPTVCSTCGSDTCLKDHRLEEAAA